MNHDQSENSVHESLGVIANDVESILRLMGAGGPLYIFPGPIVIVGEELEIIAANPAAIRIVHGLQTGNAVSVSALISAARSGSARPQTLRMLDDDSGITTDLVAVPIDTGDAVLLMGRDISLDQNLRNALVDSRQRYKDLVEVSSDFAWETDSDGVFVFVSVGGALGYEPDGLVGRRAEELVVRPGGVQILLPFNANDRMDGVEFDFVRADGSVASLVASAAPLFDTEGSRRGARGICRDVTDERARDAALAKARNRERLLTYIVRTMRDEVEPEAMLEAAAQAITRAFSAQGCCILSVDSDDQATITAIHGEMPVGTTVDEIVSDVATNTVIVRLNDGELRFLGQSSTYHQERNGGLVLWRALSTLDWDRDEISLLTEVVGQIGIAVQQVAAHRNLERLSTTDPLTGLLNRRTFVERITRRISKSEENANPDLRPGTLAYIDLDNFKQVNDQLGHQAGDEALIAVSNYLTDEAASADIVARLGGDEFAMWLEQTDENDAAIRGIRLQAGVGRLEKFSVSKEKPLGLSVGMAVFAPNSSEDMEQLVARADTTMYDIKKGGKGAFGIAAPFRETRED